MTAEDGTRLRVWEDASETESNDESPDEAVLFVHGAITHSRALFAPPVEDENGRPDDSYSWLRATADAGRTAYALDVRGYGDSEFPPEMDEPPEANDPPVRAADAETDVAAAFEFAAERHESVHVVGVSWGTMTTGRFVAERQDASEATSDADEPNAGAQRGDAAAFEAVWRAMVESGQGEATDRDDAYVAQTGALADVRDGFAGDPPYDPGEISVPTLVVRGSDDDTSRRSDALTLYDELAAADDRKEYAELAGADHYAMHGDRRRTLYDVIAAFHDRN